MANPTNLGVCPKSSNLHSGPIPRHDFAALLEFYRLYIQKIAQKHAGPHPYCSMEDIFQELSMVLWQVQQKYPTKPDSEFHDILVSSLINKIVAHFRVKRVGRDNAMVRLDAESKGSGSHGSRRDPYPIVRTEQSEDFYRAGIFELVDTLPPETKQAALDAMDPANRGHVGGSKKAYHVVKNALNGV